MTPPVSFITTVRIADQFRLRNLNFVLDWYRQMTGWEIVVIEQDDAPRFESDDWPPATKRLFVRNDGPFNKNWGYNVGVRVARGDVLFFCDADLLLPHSGLTTAASLCARRAMAVNPFDRLIDLGESQTESLIAGASAPDFEHGDASQIRNGRERLCLCGGAFFMRRGLHQLMGGFDERFLGWGGEDDANSFRMRRVTNEIAELEQRAAIHLWHGRSELSTFCNPHYPNNLQLLSRVQQLPDMELRFLCEVQRQIMGNPGKYESHCHNTTRPVC